MQPIQPYYHHVWYYETDQMSIAHHSNYIRWLEEGRMDFLRQLHLSCKEMEAMGIIIPVTGVSCQYKNSARFDDNIKVETTLTAFNGVRMTFSYRLWLPDGSLCATGESGHCFLMGGLPINLKRKQPALCQSLIPYIEE